MTCICLRILFKSINIWLQCQTFLNLIHTIHYLQTSAVPFFNLFSWCKLLNLWGFVFVIPRTEIERCVWSFSRKGAKYCKVKHQIWEWIKTLKSFCLVLSGDHLDDAFVIISLHTFYLILLLLSCIRLDLFSWYVICSQNLQWFWWRQQRCFFFHCWKWWDLWSVFCRELGRQRGYIELDTPSMSAEQIEALEKAVNEKIRQHIPVNVRALSLDDPELEQVNDWERFWLSLLLLCLLPLCQVQFTTCNCAGSSLQFWFLSGLHLEEVTFFTY